MNTRALLLVVLTLSPLGSTAAAPPSILPYDQVEPGMKGTGRTTFDGTEIVSFDVEILGKLSDIGPDQDLILARCSGGPLERTGVLSGMSGSPVTIDGKLIGALAYSWGFSTEAIAGITPIEEMLAIGRRSGSAVGSRAAADVPARSALQRLHTPDRIPRFFDDLLEASVYRAPGGLQATVPLAISGVGAAGLARIGPDLSRAGFLPLQAGSAPSSSGPAPRLEPGSAMGVKLVRGALEMTATGTVTWVDGNDVLAFGHPLFGLGAVDLPLTAARVETLLPSLMQSARIASPLAEVGALRQDRASGIFGRLGATPRMIPIRLKLSHAADDDRDYSFDVVDDPLLSPLLLYFSLNGILANRERTFGSATVRVREGSVIKMGTGDDVELDNLFSGSGAFDAATGIPAYILYLLMNNVWSTPEIVGVNLILEYDEQPRTGRIRRVSLDRYRVRAGDAVEATVVFGPFRGADEIHTRTVRIPEETPPGTLTLHVGGALAVSRAEEQYEPVLPSDLAQLIRLINQLRRNDQIFIAATREDGGILLNGVRMPNLPPSIAQILSRPRRRGNLVPVARRAVLEERIDTRYAVEGSARIELEVEAR